MNGITQAVADIKSFVTERLSGEATARQALTKKIDALELFLQQRGSAGGNGDDPGYRGFWPSAKMAADFGALVVCLCCKDGALRDRAAQRFASGGYTIRRADGAFADRAAFVKDLGIGADATGGYLAPDEIAREMIRNVEQFGAFRRYATIVPMARERQKWPKRAGGFTVYYPDEGRAATPSDLALGMVALTAKKWAVYTRVSLELEEDSLIDIGTLVGMEFALAIAQAEDTNGFMGDGTAAFGGIVGVLNSPNVVAVPMPAGKTAFTDLSPDDLVALCVSVPSWAKRTDAAYYMSPEALGVVMKMRDGIGRPIYIDPNDGFGGRVNGYPVREVTAMPGLAESAAGVPFIAFGSLRLWGFLGQRRTFAIEASRDVLFLEDQIALKAVPRQDIQEADGDAMAVLFTAAV